MDLFVVNRYYGDEKSSKFLLDKSTPEQEKEEDKTNILEVSDSHKVKKKKKKESGINFSLDSGSSSKDIEACDTETPISKKKSKRKQIEELGEHCLVEKNDTNLLVRKNSPNFSKNSALTIENDSGEKKSKKKKISEIIEIPITEINEGSNKKEKKRKFDLDCNGNPSEEDKHVNTIENQSNDVNKMTSTKKNKRKSAKFSSSFINDDEVSIENQNSLDKKKKIKTLKRLESSPDIVSEKNQGNIDKSQDVDIDSSKISSSKKKKKSYEHNQSTDSELPIEREVFSDINKRLKPLPTPSEIEEDCPKTSTSSEKIHSSQNKNFENSNTVGTNKTKVTGDILNEEKKPDETSKKGKKRFRQRARYKDRPKNENIKNNESKKEEETVDKESSADEEKDSNDLGGFQVIGNLEFQKKKKVKRVLPDWLAKPTVISMNLKNLKTKVEDIKELDPYYKKMLAKNGVSHLFPVQNELIPFLIKQHSRRTIFWPRDVCVSAPTGSGKTLAFVLPILQLLQYRVVPRIRALVVLPTQDLANQVYSVFKSYVKGTKLQVVLTVGSSPIQEEQKKLVSWDILKEKYVSLVDIVVTTPGRLVDHLTNSPGFDLSGLKFLVVDEADRMIDNNDCNWLLHINKHINYQGLNSAPPLMLHTFLTYPSRPQRLLFSATLSHDPEKLHALGLFQPKLFTSVVDATAGDDSSILPVSSEKGEPPVSSSGFIGKFTTPAELREKLTTTSASLKPLVVHQLIKRNAWKGVLCFVNTAQGAHRLAKLLHLIETVSSRNAAGGTTSGNAADSSPTKLNIAEVYSDLKFEQRNKIIQDFRRRKIDLVVASDNLARGIDVENIDVVINYEAPDNIKKYIHRIGRTARGGREGTSVTLVTPHERNGFLKMLSSVGKQNIEDLECAEEELEHLEEVYAKVLELLKKDVEREGEMTLKIAKAQKKGKIIKKKKMLLDGSPNKNFKGNAQNKSSNKKEQKSSIKIVKEVEEKKPDESTGDKLADKKVQTPSHKTVKRSQIKKVVNKTWKPKGQHGTFSKKKNKKTPDMTNMRNEGKSKRNLKIKKKKQLKKQAQNQSKPTETKPKNVTKNKTKKPTE